MRSSTSIPRNGVLRTACTAAAMAIMSCASVSAIIASETIEKTSPRFVSVEELRKLNENNKNNEKNENNKNDNKQQEDEAEEEGFYTDLTPYSLRLERCQYVKQFDDTSVSSYYNYGSSSMPVPTSPLSLEQFVVFRLCPADSCSTGCDSEYGEYVTTMYDYLYYLTTMNGNRMESLCNACTNYCWDNAVENFSHQGTSVTCDGCKNKCNSYQNLHAFGYVDAANYVKCTAIYKQTKHSYTNSYGETEYSTTTKTYYVGPKCVTQSKYHSATSKSRHNRQIRIGVFSDINCWEPLPNVHVEDVLGYKVNYHKFRISDSGDQECLACKTDSSSNYNQNKNYNNKNNREGNSKDNQNNKNQKDFTLTFCYNIYDKSAKCEAKHGFASGMAQVNGYDAQLAIEESTCTYVDSVVYDSYNAYGEIETYEEQDVYDQYVTHGQKMSLLFLSVAILGLIIYGNFLHAEIDDGYPTIRLHVLAEKAQQQVEQMQQMGGIFT